ncbi:MAG: hypothetical protein PVF43_15255 [Candidatus Eiseniibacteriota bacterium]|jgi:hypothetical protein
MSGALMIAAMAALLVVAQGIAGTDDAASTSQASRDQQGRPMMGQMMTQNNGTRGGMGSGMGAAGMMNAQEMMKKLQEMANRQQEIHAQLDELVTRMNASSGDAQQQVMAQLLTKIVVEQGALQQTMMKMQPLMMEHMMGRMNGASGDGDRSDHPMMQQGMHGGTGG